MKNFDFNAPAEIFASKGRGFGPRAMTYRRFSTAADAVRYALEALPANMLPGTVMEVREARFDAGEIRRLYQRPDYPLPRSLAA